MYLARNRAGGTASILGDLWRYSLSLDLGGIGKRGVVPCREDMPVCLQSQLCLSALFHAEFANDVYGVAMLAVNGFVHCAHVVCGDLSGQCMKSNRNLRPTAERVVAHQGDRIVGREVVTVVLQSNEAESLVAGYGLRASA